MTPRTILTMLAILVPTTLGAALPPCAEDERMRKATDVVQISVESVEIPAGIGQPSTTVYCAVTGTVVRVFRGSAKTGDNVGVRVLCYTDAVGAGWVTDPKALEDAKVIEVHALNGEPVRGGASVAILPGPTAEMTWEPSCK